MTYPDIKPGQEVVIDPQKNVLQFACCDCSLVHTMEFRIRKGKIVLRAWRNNRRTATLRKRDERLSKQSRKDLR